MTTFVWSFTQMPTTFCPFSNQTVLTEFNIHSVSIHYLWINILISYMSFQFYMDSKLPMFSIKGHITPFQCTHWKSEEFKEGFGIEFQYRLNVGGFLLRWVLLWLLLKYQSLVSIYETVKYNIKFTQFECTQNKHDFMWKKTLKMTSPMRCNEILKTVHSDWCINLNDYKESLMFVLLGP